MEERSAALTQPAMAAMSLADASSGTCCLGVVSVSV